MSLRFLSVLFCTILVGCATIPETTTVSIEPTMTLQSVEEAANDLARKFGPRNVLVAFDLDNTLLAMESELGADQWYDWQSRTSKETPCHPGVVHDRLDAQGALFHLGAMRPTEPGIQARIDRLVERGHPVMIVTARGADFRLQTFREMRRNNLSLRGNPPGGSGSGEPFALPGGQRDVLYEDGALLLAGQHKGDMLLALMQVLDYDLPKAVVFADDKDKNVEAMRDGLNKAGISGRLFRYDRELARVQAFDPDAAAEAWRHLRPALGTVAQLMGEHNFELPSTELPEECRQ